MPSDPAIVSRQGVVRELRQGQVVLGVVGEGCSSCGKQGGCAVGKLAGSRRETLIALPANAAFKLGDSVALEIAGEQLLGAALRGYLLPALCLLVGAGLGQALGAGDTAAACGALAGLVLGLGAARRLHKRCGDNSALSVRQL